MKECFQFQTMNILDHGEDVRAWYNDLRYQLTKYPPATAGWGEWKLPEWINHPSIKEHFATADDEIIRLYQIYHDCGKPFCREVDAEGRQHFPNHAEVSKARWLECGGSQEVADLIGMDMDVHTLKACDVEEFAKRPQAITLLLTGLCELHSNAQMFGGIDSVGFKMKFKNLERFGKRIVAASEKLVDNSIENSYSDTPVEATTKICADCDEEKPCSSFTQGRKGGGLYSYCTDCHARHNRERRTRHRLAALEHYSSTSPPSCECCSETLTELLAIDHIDGGGGKHRRSKVPGIINFPTWLKNQGYPSGYRILCHNCNTSYGLYGYCPHKTGTQVVAPEFTAPHSSLYCYRGHPMFGATLRLTRKAHGGYRWCIECKRIAKQKHKTKEQSDVK